MGARPGSFLAQPQLDCLCPPNQQPPWLLFSEQPAKFFGHPEFKAHFLAADRVDEGERTGVEREMFADRRTVAVFFVPCHGMPLFREMDADLVLAAGEEMNIHQAEPSAFS